MALPGETGGRRPVTQLPVIRTSRGTASKSTSALPTIRNSGSETSRREGDYIIYSRNGVVTRREYSPLRTASKAAAVVGGNQVPGRAPTSSTSTATNKAKTGGTSVAQPKMTNVGGGAATGFPAGAAYASGAGTGAPGAPGDTFGTPNIAQSNPYGWTSGMSEEVRDLGLSYNPRIMEQVLGRPISALTQNALMPYIDQASNPWLQLLMAQGLGTGTGVTSSPDDDYNFRANFMQNAITPGGSRIDFQEALRVLAQGMANPSSALWGGLMANAEAPENAGGVPSALNLMANFADALSAVNGGLSNASMLGLSGLMPQWQDAYLKNFVPSQASNMDPLAFLMRNVFGINAPMARPSAPTQSLSSTNFNPFS